MQFRLLFFGRFRSPRERGYFGQSAAEEVPPRQKGGEARIKLAYEEEEFRRSPRFPKVYNDIKRLFLKADICIGFAVGNDVRYLNNACQIFRLPIIEYRFCDVQMLAGFIDETNKGMGLSRLGEKYGIEFLEHKSDDDAFATLMLFQKLCESCKMGAKELLDYYEIVPGVNAKDGVKGMFSLAQIYNRKGLKRSKAQSGILLHEFLREMKKRPKAPGEFARKAGMLLQRVGKGRYSDRPPADQAHLRSRRQLYERSDFRQSLRYER